MNKYIYCYEGTQTNLITGENKTNVTRVHRSDCATVTRSDHNPVNWSEEFDSLHKATNKAGIYAYEHHHVLGFCDTCMVDARV
jgi:hypothetical protein